MSTNTPDLYTAMPSAVYLSNDPHIVRILLSIAMIMEIALIKVF